MKYPPFISQMALNQWVTVLHLERAESWQRFSPCANIPKKTLSPPKGLAWENSRLNVGSSQHLKSRGPCPSLWGREEPNFTKNQLANPAGLHMNQFPASTFLWFFTSLTLLNSYPTLFPNSPLKMPITYVKIPYCTIITDQNVILRLSCPILFIFDRRQERKKLRRQSFPQDGHTMCVGV
jgi:hypothetical protein